jgi:hypothetical protein
MSISLSLELRIYTFTGRNLGTKIHRTCRHNFYSRKKVGYHVTGYKLIQLIQYKECDVFLLVAIYFYPSMFTAATPVLHSAGGLYENSTLEGIF